MQGEEGNKSGAMITNGYFTWAEESRGFLWRVRHDWSRGTSMGNSDSGGEEARHRIEMSSKSTVTKKSRDLVNNHAEGRLDDVGSAKSVVAWSSQAWGK
jgi:hypothetical protein